MGMEENFWSAACKSFGKLLLAVGLVALAFTFVRLAEFMFGEHGLLLLAILFGGAGGGFTLALIGGEKYGLKMPGLHGIGTVKFDPGYLGDVFVGLMASFLGVATSARTLKTDIFDPSQTPLVDLWFIDFGIAYASGFLGLKLIKAFSAKFLADVAREAEDDDRRETVADTAILSGNEAIREGTYDLAAAYYRKAHQLDNNTSIRALIGLGRVYRRQGKIGDAIAMLNDAIEMKSKEAVTRRVAVAYWNRACYTVLADPESEDAKAMAIEDLKASIALQESYRHDLKTEEDLKSLRSDPRLIGLAVSRNGAAAPKPSETEA